MFPNTISPSHLILSSGQGRTGLDRAGLGGTRRAAGSLPPAPLDSPHTLVLMMPPLAFTSAEFCHLNPPNLIKKTNTECQGGRGRLEPSFAGAGNATWCSCFGQHLAVSHKTEHGCPVTQRSFLGTHPREAKTQGHGTRTRKFPAALFAITKRWRRLKRPSVHERISKTQSVDPGSGTVSGDGRK